MRRSFADDLASLCSREAIAAKGDPKRLAEMTERLTYSLAFTVSIGASTPEQAQEMLIGCETYLYECATKLGIIMQKLRD